MGAIVKRIYIGQPATTVETLYVVPIDNKAIIKNIIITNVTAASGKINIHFVPSGGVADSTNRIISNYSIEANGTVSIDISGVLETGDTIQASQDTTNAITVYISGVEVI